MPQLDPITLEVMWSGLISVVDEEARALVRSSFSTVVSEAEDLSVCLFDTEGNMLVQSNIGAPGHINTMTKAVKQLLRECPTDTLRPRDAFICNDPWLLAGHFNDVMIINPIFHRNGIVGLIGSVCHQTDIGGRGFAADSTEAYEEGLHIPLMKFLDRGAPNEALHKIIMKNVRLPDLSITDLKVQAAANEVGAERTRVFLKRFSLKDLALISAAIRGMSEKAAKKAVAELPEGEYNYSINVDGFDEPLKIVATITVSDETLTVDYTGTSPQVGRGINTVHNYTRAYSLFALKSVLLPHLPNNDGAFLPFKFVIPEGCVLNARYPAPVSGGHIIGHYAAPTILGCLSKAVPEKVIAEGGLRAMTMLDGYDNEGRRFLFVMFNHPGMGARAVKDGLSASAFPTNVPNIPVEVVESVSPIFFTEKALVQNSAGAGKFRGGFGQRIKFRIRSPKPATLSAVYERTTYPPAGFFGGLSGKVGEVSVDGKRLHPKMRHSIQPGQEVSVTLAAGGGFYPPTEREPQLVLRDVVDGYVSPEAAEKMYRVKIDTGNMSIDWEGTEKLRTKKY